MLKTYAEREYVKFANNDILYDTSLPMEDRIIATENIMDVYYDRSAEEVLIGYGHPSPEKYFAV